MLRVSCTAAIASNQNFTPGGERLTETIYNLLYRPDEDRILDRCLYSIARLPKIFDDLHCCRSRHTSPHLSASLSFLCSPIFIFLPAPSCCVILPRRAEAAWPSAWRRRNSRA